MARHELGQKPLTCLGVDLQRPADRTSPGKWPAIENVVAVQDSTITPRPGLGTSALATAPANKTPWHSKRTLNDPTAGAGVWCRAHGIGDSLCAELSSTPGTIVSKLTGLSGNPLSMMQARPAESPQPFMYVADSLAMRKMDRLGNLKQVGLPAPTIAPTALLNGAPYKTIDLFEAGTVPASWTAAGGATGPLAITPVNTTIPAANGRTWEGLACVAPTAMTNIVAGSVLAIATSLGTETVLVTEVHSGSPVLAIVRILYDSGTTGLCSIVLEASTRQIEADALMVITGVASAGSEAVRVREVTYGPDGTIAIRCSTTVQRLATDTIEIKPSFNCYTLGTPTLGGAITSGGMQSGAVAAVTGPTPATLTRVVALDLSTIGTGLAGSSDDYMSLLIRASAPANITEIRILLDCDAAGGGAGTVFTQNYFLKAFTQSDLTSMIEYLQTALASRQDQIQRGQLDSPGFDYRYPKDLPKPARGGARFTPGEYEFDHSDRPYNEPSAGEVSDPTGVVDPSRSQLKPGDSQFTAIKFRLSEMQRMGSDESRGWKDICAIQIAFLCTGTITLDFDAWIMRGGYQPEVGDIDPDYEYRYRGYDSSTGVMSNASPASRGNIRPCRQSVAVSLTQHPSSECDKLLVERRGGPVRGWRPIGTLANGVSPTFDDLISNGSAESQFEVEPSGLTLCQPWPLVQRPLVVTGAVVAGTLIYDAGASFSYSGTLLRGIPVRANGKLSYLRRLLSASMIEVEDNMGSSGSATVELPRPVLVGQPLPVLVGGGWDLNRSLALGDPSDPSAYYVSLRGNFDATTELLRFEIPGAILQNAAVYNGSMYVWSTEHLYRIDDAGVDSFGNLQLRAIVIPGARGLAARWACCAGDRLYWLARDGICASDGGAPVILTDEDLYPLFPHDGVAGVAVNGFNPPNLASGQEANLRLSYGGGRLRFLYLDSGGTRRELEYRMRTDAPSGWYPHVYTPGVASADYEEGPAKRAWLMGGADATTAKLYQLTDSQSDGGTAIAWSATPQYENVGDPRKLKRWGDFTSELDRDGATVTVTPRFDLGATALAAINVTTGTGLAVRIHDLASAGVVAGSGVLAVNMAPAFSGSVTTERPRIHTWEPTWLGRPEVTQLRATDFEDANPSGPKYVRGVWLTFDSRGLTRTADVYRDGNLTTAAASLTGITSASGPKRQYFAFATPFYASTLLVLPTDAGSWMLFDVEWVADPAPDLSDGPSKFSDLGYAGAKLLQGVIVDGDTANVAVNLVIEGDEAVTLATIPNVQHNGRAQKCYTFDPPVLTHLVRINPSAAIRLWHPPPDEERTRWIWEPEPELAEHYETQQTTHDIDEVYKIVRDAQITLRSSSIVTFSIYDGSLGTGSTALFSTAIASTAGLRKPVYIPISSIKAKSFIYVLDGGGTGFALYRRDSWVRVRGWGRTVAVLGGEAPAGWMMAKPFGADHRVQGALV